eukprot:2806157-Pyramimonas_sp.AAC.1
MRLWGRAPRTQSVDEGARECPSQRQTSKQTGARAPHQGTEPRAPRSSWRPIATQPPWLVQSTVYQARRQAGA